MTTKSSDQAYLAAEAKARVEIDRQLAVCGWLVQDRAELNLYAGPGVAVREFTMSEGHGRADYLLFVDRQAVGTIEANGPALTGLRLNSEPCFRVQTPGLALSVTTWLNASEIHRWLWWRSPHSESPRGTRI